MAFGLFAVKVNGYWLKKFKYKCQIQNQGSMFVVIGGKKKDKRQKTEDGIRKKTCPPQSGTNSKIKHKYKKTRMKDEGWKDEGQGTSYVIRS